MVFSDGIKNYPLIRHCHFIDDVMLLREDGPAVVRLDCGTGCGSGVIIQLP